MAVSSPRRALPTDQARDAETRIAALVDAHGAALLRTARHHSLCDDDAHDAMQRALEIYLRRLETVDAATEGAWMKVVVRHEAMAVRRHRTDSVTNEEIDFDTQPDVDLRGPDDRLAGAERSARSAEALRRLKPDEAKALLLKAEGLSYAEIGERHGWTYTKTNRAITEGRRRFLRAYAELEAGDGCEGFRTGLAELARGVAPADTMMVLRPHLRHCPACRATVRELRGGRARTAAWLPWPFGAWALRPRDAQPTLDYATNAAEAGGTLPASPEVAAGRWADLKLQLQSLLHRFNGSDVATSVHVATSSGGGRATSIAALIGFCLSGVGAGTYCVATLVLPAEPPKPVVRKAEAKPARKAPQRSAKAAAGDRPVELITARQPVAVRTPTPTATPARPRKRKRDTAPAAPPSLPTQPASSQATASQTATSHEASPPPAPAIQGQQELSFEQAAPASGGNTASQPAPAAAPATGGGEFGP